MSSDEDRFLEQLERANPSISGFVKILRTFRDSPESLDEKTVASAVFQVERNVKGFKLVLEQSTDPRQEAYRENLRQQIPILEMILAELKTAQQWIERNPNIKKIIKAEQQLQKILQSNTTASPVGLAINASRTTILKAEIEYYQEQITLEQLNEIKQTEENKIRMLNVIASEPRQDIQIARLNALNLDSVTADDSSITVNGKRIFLVEIKDMVVTNDTV